MMPSLMNSETRLISRTHVSSMSFDLGLEVNLHSGGIDCIMSTLSVNVIPLLLSSITE